MGTVATYEPSQQNPVHDLTLAIRKLRTGDAICMPDGTVVRSTVMKHGSTMERRFAVVPAERKSTPGERHKALVLGHASCKTAEEAAKKALNE